MQNTMSQQQKRYQYYGPKGIIMWTNWFNIDDCEKHIKRQPNGLLYEYKTV